MAFKPCLRRTAYWMAENAWIAAAAVEPMAQYRCQLPWETDADCTHLWSICPRPREDLTHQKSRWRRLNGPSTSTRWRTWSSGLMARLIDSTSGLQLLQRGPAGQTTKLASNVWSLLLEPGSSGATINIQWVPGNAGIDGDVAADRLASEASCADQADVPVDLASAQSAIRRHMYSVAGPC